MTETKELIEYTKQYEWGGFTLTERPDGLWIYDQYSMVQGQTSGRRVVIRPPSGWTAEDEADMDTLYGCDTNAVQLIHNGQEMRCLRRGCTVC